MNNTPILIALFSALAFSPVSNAKQQEEQLPRLLETVTFPQPIKRVHPNYPKLALRKGAEGWVQVNFVVGKDGRVSDATVVDSAGHRSFQKETISTIKKWQYEPAKIDGEPVEQCLEVRLDFGLSNNGVSHSFRKMYKNGMNLLVENKLAEAKELIFDEKWDNQSSTTQLTWLHSLRAAYFGKTNEADKQLKALYRTHSKPSSKNWGSALDDRVVVENLYNMFAIEMELKKYKAALRTYQSLQYVTHSNATEYMEKLLPYKQRIIDIVEGDTPIPHHITIPEKGNSSHDLVRNAFAIGNIVDGELAKVDIRCAKQRSVFTIKENSQWTIPESWGQCRILIDGDTGTKFELVELNSSGSNQV